MSTPLRSRAALLAGIAFLAAAPSLSAAEPGWWHRRELAAVTEAKPDSAATTAQARTLAKAALNALRLIVPKVAAEVEKDLVGKDKPVASWKTAGKDAAPLSAAGLKAIATPFYTHLHDFAPQWLERKLKANQAFSEGSFLPWPAVALTDDAPVTLALLRTVFALDFVADDETPADGIPDLWEEGVVHADPSGKWTEIGQITLLNAALIGAKSPAGPPPKVFALEATNEVDRRLAGKSAEKALAMYDDYPSKAIAGKLVRNPGFWAADMAAELTCLSPFNFMDQTKRAGTLLTPRHVLVAKHFFFNPGTLVQFVTADNQTIARTVLAASSVASPNPPPGQEAYTDFEIAVLDEDLPPSIRPCQVAPADFSSYLPPVAPGPITTARITGPPIPALGSNQRKEGMVSQLQAVLGGKGRDTVVSFAPPDEKLTPLRREFFRPLIIGDSGSPSFFIVGGKPMLTTTWTNGGGGGGWAIWDCLPQVNAAIAAADAKAKIKPTGYKVKSMDLSRFVKFD